MPSQLSGESSTVPPGLCLLHGPYLGGVCPGCSTAVPFQLTDPAIYSTPPITTRRTKPMMMVYPTYIVTWRMTVGSHEHELVVRVPEPELDAFLKVLRFNGVREFGARADT